MTCSLDCPIYLGRQSMAHFLFPKEVSLSLPSALFRQADLPALQADLPCRRGVVIDDGICRSDGSR